VDEYSGTVLGDNLLTDFPEYLEPWGWAAVWVCMSPWDWLMCNNSLGHITMPVVNPW